MLILIAALVALGLGATVALALIPRAETSGVSRSLELIRSTEVADVTPLEEQSAGQRLGIPFLGALASLGKRLTPVGTPERLRRRLDLAGNVPPWDVQSVLAAKAAGLICLGGLGLLTWLTRRSIMALLFFVAMAALGYWLADILLYNAGDKRQQAMRRAAPDALDMLSICVEAGLGFDAALGQVAEKTRGPLAAEFARVLTELQLGRSRDEAFAHLAARTNAPEIKSFVSALTQADRLGVPVAGVLKEQAGELRIRRRQWAEEKAQKVPVKIVFPVVFCIFPALFVIVIGPGVIRMIETFSGR